MTLTRTPFSLNANPDQLLPLQPNGEGVIPLDASPYLSRSPSYSDHEVTIDLVTKSGSLDSLGIDLTNDTVNSRLAHDIIASWRHPSRLTVTEAVVKLEHAHNWYQSITYNLRDGTRRQAWLLVGGAPATAQQSWYLFDTTNRGKTWSLERYTVWQGCRSATEPPVCSFLRSAGQTSMLFWNGEDGLIAQANFSSNKATLFRTSTGGKTWSPLIISLPQQPESLLLHRHHGIIVLTVIFFGLTPKETGYSRNGGATWTEFH